MLVQVPGGPRERKAPIIGPAEKIGCSALVAAVSSSGRENLRLLASRRP